MQYNKQLYQQIAAEIANSPLLRYIVKTGSAYALFNLIRKKTKKGKLSRRNRRKFLNKRRRWFTDNIIMHHRRLHKKNRDIVLEIEPQERIKQKLKRKKELKSKEKEKKWREKDKIKQRGMVLRGRIDARRLKARSKWLSVA